MASGWWLARRARAQCDGGPRAWRARDALLRVRRCKSWNHERNGPQGVQFRHLGAATASRRATPDARERIPTTPRARTTDDAELNRVIAESKELATVRSTAAGPSLNSSPSSLRR